MSKLLKAKTPQFLEILPALLLILIWLVSGRTSPGGILENYSIFRWLSYPLIFTFAILWIFRFSLRPVLLISGIEKIIAAIAILLTVSMFLNNNTFRDLVEGVFVYLRYPILFLLIINNYKGYRWFDFFSNTLIFIGFLLILEGLANYFLFGLARDDTFISLGMSWGHAIGGIWLLYGLIIINSKLLVQNMTKWTRIVFYSSITVSVLIIASVRSAILFFPVLFIISWLIQQNRFKVEWVKFCGIIALVTILFFSFYTYAEGSFFSFPHWINPQYRLDYIGGVIHELYDRNQLIFGAGPRSMAPRTYLSPGHLYEYFSINYPSFMYSGTNQFVKAIPELGLVGFFLYLLMLLKILNMNIKIWNSHQLFVLTGNEKMVCLSFFPIWLHYFSIGLFANDLWRFDISALIFWMMSAQIVLIFFKCDSSSGHLHSDSNQYENPGPEGYVRVGKMKR